MSLEVLDFQNNVLELKVKSLKMEELGWNPHLENLLINYIMPKLRPKVLFKRKNCTTPPTPSLWASMNVYHIHHRVLISSVFAINMKNWTKLVERVFRCHDLGPSLCPANQKNFFSFTSRFEDNYITFSLYL